MTKSSRVKNNDDVMSTDCVDQKKNAKLYRVNVVYKTRLIPLWNSLRLPTMLQLLKSAKRKIKLDANHYIVGFVVSSTAITIQNDADVDRFFPQSGVWS